MSLLMPTSCFRFASRGRRLALEAACAAGFLLLAIAVPTLTAQQSPEKVEEINKEFHFLGPDDTVLIHEEDGKLKGQINVYPGEEESDEILSYDFTIGTRKGDHLELKTAKVHERYYRFVGAVERGTGRKERDPDYLRLVGNLEIITVNGMTGKETTESKRVIFKSLGADEIQD